MGKFIGGLMPHPPIMVPDVGKDEVEKIAATIDAAERLAQSIKEFNPQTIIIITPHGPVFEDTVSISVHPRMHGTLAAFDAPDVSLGFETDGLMVRHILKNANRLGVNVTELTDDLAKTYRFSLQLDHGALVPLYYLHKAGFKGQLVHMSIGMVPYEEMYTLGKAVQMTMNLVDKKYAVIASGDLSHRVTSDAPAGYSPRGREFDEQLIQALKAMDLKALLGMDKQLIEEAGECGMRPIFFLMGALGGLSVKSEILSYEAPFGVGYCVARFTVENGDPGKGNKEGA